MSRPIQNIKQSGGKVGSGKMRNAGSTMSGDNKVKPIKNAVGMCSVGGQGYAKIKGAVSG